MGLKRTHLLLLIALIMIVLASVVLLIIKRQQFFSFKFFSKSSTSISQARFAHQEELILAPNDNAPEPNFINVVPITFNVGQYQEFLIQTGEVVALKVSPEGQRIVYEEKRGNAHILGLLDLVEGKPAQLDLGFDDYVDASWSADGQKLVFGGLKNGNWEIFLYDLKVKNLKQLTTDPNRKKSWPRVSPFKFDGHYRVAYVSEQDNRKDIWWVRESGQYDMPITQRDSMYDSTSVYWDSLMPPPSAITTGGEAPEWSPSGNLLLYRTAKKYSVLGYSYYSWWSEQNLPLPTFSGGILTWSPNQTAFLFLDQKNWNSSIISRDSLGRKIEAVRGSVAAIGYFPDGRAFAYSSQKNGQSIIAVQPFDDPLGDIANLWMYSYRPSQKMKLKKNQLLFLNTEFDQIYSIYETERYSCGGVDPNFPSRPYIVTSDAVLEAFYAGFAALYAAMERSQLTAMLKEFSRQGLASAFEKKVSKDAVLLFETGFGLLDESIRSTLSPEALAEIKRVERATGSETSLWGRKIDYSDFYIRGKYERDSMMQSYFRAVKWYQAFTFDLDSSNDRRRVAEILSITNAPTTEASLESIYSSYQEVVGESRYYSPLNLKSIAPEEPLASFKSNLPWIQNSNSFRLLPSIYTLDAYVFDELITHADRKVTVGTLEMPRLLPKGMDVMAALGSDEAFKILTSEFKEGRFANYEATLVNVREKIKGFSPKEWDANVYQAWLYALQSLVNAPDSQSPGFTKTSAWRRKQLNTALGSWVNLRYETIAVVEQVGSECGEGGYEQLNIGKPKGYVEPNPEFFHRLDDGFAKIATLFERTFSNKALATAAQQRIADYRMQIQSLERIANKELHGQEITDIEYDQILEIGGSIEHFILIMGSLNGKDDEHTVRLPDPIRKIVDIQKDNSNGVRLYEALGYANEINVAVPYFGRRQIVKGPVYSYYEFQSDKALDSKKWQENMDQPYPAWVAELYDGTGTKSLYNLLDLVKGE